MKKAEKILFIIGMVVSFVSAFMLLIGSAVFGKLGSLDVSEIQNAIDQLDASSQQFLADAGITAELIKRIFSSCAFLFIGEGILCIANGILTIFAMKKQSKAWYIVTVITGAITGSVTTVASIFGLVSESKHKEKAPAIEG